MTRAFIILNFLILKKQILNLGKGLSKAQQKLIHGGSDPDEGNCSGENANSMKAGCACLYASADNCKSGECEYVGHVFGACT